MGTFKYFLADAVKQKIIVHQFYFIGVFSQAKVNNRVFVKFYIRYAEYFPEYSSYCGRSLRLLKYMYGITKYGKLSSDELAY